jgi:hypothetical protein
MRRARALTRSPLVIASVAAGFTLATVGGIAVASSSAPAAHPAKHAQAAKKKPPKKGHRGPRGRRGLVGPRGPAGPVGPTGAAGPTGPSGLTAVWSASAYPPQGRPLPSSEVAHLTFTSTTAGFALVTANFSTRVRNTAGTDCRVQSQIASTATPPAIAVGGASAPGFADQWINGNLPTQNGAGTYLGLSASATRVLPIVVGSNTIYLNGASDCLDALWGPITMTAQLAQTNPTATLVTS